MKLGRQVRLEEEARRSEVRLWIKPAGRLKGYTFADATCSCGWTLTAHAATEEEATEAMKVLWLAHLEEHRLARASR
jgi:predicted nucleic acid-binding Zn finger protein